MQLLKNIAFSPTEPSKDTLWFVDGVLKGFGPNGWVPIKAIDPRSAEKIREINNALSDIDEDLEILRQNRVEDSEKIDSLDKEVGEIQQTKQDKLTPGRGIDIKNNTISSTLDVSLYKVVQELPSSNIDTDKIYLVLSEKQEQGNVYTEYVYVDGKWETIGSYTSSVDLSDYYDKLEVDQKYFQLSDTLNKVKTNELYQYDISVNSSMENPSTAIIEVIRHWESDGDKDIYVFLMRKRKARVIRWKIHGYTRRQANIWRHPYYAFDLKPFNYTEWKYVLGKGLFIDMNPVCKQFLTRPGISVEAEQRFYKFNGSKIVYSKKSSGFGFAVYEHDKVLGTYKRVSKIVPITVTVILDIDTKELKVTSII